MFRQNASYQYQQNAFPSPCEDVMFQMMNAIKMSAVEFPSPCGDVMFPCMQKRRKKT